MKKVKSVVQRNARREGIDGPFSFVFEYLTGEALARQWTRNRAEAYEFPDYMPAGHCSAGAHCTEHAECAAKAHGGCPAVVGDPGPAPIPAPAPACDAAPVSPITQRIHQARHNARKAAENRRPIPPEEAFERMEKRGHA